jgi:hypothetical protein
MLGFLLQGLLFDLTITGEAAKPLTACHMRSTACALPVALPAAAAEAGCLPHTHIGNPASCMTAPRDCFTNPDGGESLTL